MLAYAQTHRALYEEAPTTPVINLEAYTLVHYTMELYPNGYLPNEAEYILLFAKLNDQRGQDKPLESGDTGLCVSLFCSLTYFLQ